MTSLTFETLVPLIFLGVIPVLWWSCRRSIVDLSPRHLRLLTLVRSAMVVSLVLAMTQPALWRTSSRIATVYLLDVSRSVSPGAVQGALKWIRETDEAGGASESRFQAFAANSMAYDSVDALGKVPVSIKPQAGAVDQSKTRLAAALDHAIRSFPSGHLKRLVLLSDGNANSGDLSAAITRLRGENVRVFAKAMDARSASDVWIESMLSPEAVTAEEQFPVEVHVYSQTAVPAEIELKNGHEVLGKRAVALKEGLNRIAFETNVKDESANIVLEAAVTAVGDSVRENNGYRQAVNVLGKPKVLYVEGHAPSARYLKAALTLEGFRVDVMEAARLPDSPAMLDTYDAVVVSDVERMNLSEPQMKAVATYVHDFGGGLVLASGENTYGKEGYTGSTIEEALPITFETEKERQSIAMVVVLDRSGSMAGSKMELAKEATKAPLDLLKPEDFFGVLTFDYNFQWALNVAAVTDKDAMRETISRIVATGNTNIYPALREAYEKLKPIDSETKHVILLSDGQTPAEDFKGLAAEMVKDKITVSTVAVTAASDRPLMENIATWGGGRAYYVDDPKNVPQIFQDETELAAGKSLKEENFKPVVKKVVEAFKGVDFKTAPELLGYVAAKAKPTAEVILETPGERPLLARWQYGVGKTAAFMSDLKDRWAVDWLKWKSYSKFWAQLLRETMRRRDNDTFDMKVERGTARAGAQSSRISGAIPVAIPFDEAKVTIEAVERDGRFRNALQLQLSLVDPSGGVSTLDVPQVGPGAYELRVPMPLAGSYVFRVVGEGVGSLAKTLEYSYPEEYHFYPPNFETLRTLSEQTGGVYQPAGPEIFDVGKETVAVHTLLWPAFASLALMLFVGDVLLRRLRLFE